MDWRVSSALALVLCGACATPRAFTGIEADVPRSSEDVRRAVERHWDPYRRLATATGPTVRQNDELRWSLACSRAGDEPEVIELVCAWRGESWRFLESAFDIEGRRYDLRVVDRSVSDAARVVEELRVRLPRAVLDTRSDGPLKLRLFGAKGQVDVEVPRAYVTGFLAALAQR